MMVDELAKALINVHYNGTGCSSDPLSPGNCSYCYGPSPMDAYEIVEFVLDWLEEHA